MIKIKVKVMDGDVYEDDEELTPHLAEAERNSTSSDIFWSRPWPCVMVKWWPWFFKWWWR